MIVHNVTSCQDKAQLGRRGSCAIVCLPLKAEYRFPVVHLAICLETRPTQFREARKEAECQAPLDFKVWHVFSVPGELEHCNVTALIALPPKSYICSSVSNASIAISLFIDEEILHISTAAYERQLRRLNNRKHNHKSSRSMSSASALPRIRKHDGDRGDAGRYVSSRGYHVSLISLGEKLVYNYSRL